MSAIADKEKVDEHHDEDTNVAFKKLPWVKINMGNSPIVKCNPIVTAVSAAIIWGFVIWCCVDKEDAREEIGEWKTWVADSWTWLYIISQDVWVIALIYILFSKYKNIRLGKDDEKPEFSDMTWFSMLFAAGVAVGIFYYSVSEPVWHYSGGNRWQNLPDNEKGTHSLMVTFYHWGPHGWIPYTTVGALLALLSYRRGLPMTLRFCFYPIIGDRVYGWIGDAIDIMSICCTLFGVCTSLGLGVMQLNRGLERLDKGLYRGVADHPEGRAGIETNTETQVAIIWVLTLGATISVVTGLKNGIRRLSQVCFALGMFICTAVLFMGKTEFILNMITQAIGYFIWYLPKISFHTDAFELAGQEPVGCLDGTFKCGGQGWMNGWTIFYWGWWISWGPFVGMFMAKISRGRTLGEFILGTLFLPSLYSFFWLGVFGSEGMYMDRQANIEGLTCDNIWSETTNTVKLYCLGNDDMFFEQLASYGSQPFGDFLAILSIIALALYFVTSSDSGSLVIDIIAANGIKEPPVTQKVFWALSEGAAATALLVAGKTESLGALQTVSIVCGLPYTFVLFFFTQSLLLVIKEEAGDLAIDRKGFTSFLFSSDHRCTGSLFASVGEIIMAMFAPGVVMANVQGRLNGLKTGDPLTMILANLMWVGVIVFLVLKVEEYNWMMMSASLYCMFSFWMAMLRRNVRVALNVERGNLFTDYLSVLVFYPLALSQMAAEADNIGEKGNKI